MPPQKNSGNRGAKKESGIAGKNRRFIQNLLDDLRQEGKVDSVHIARVIRRMGDGRMEVFYCEKVKGGLGMESRGRVAQAVIRGSFRGRGKHSVWIDVGSFVAIAETGVSGPAALEIVAVIPSEQMRDMNGEFDIDPRILAVDITDGVHLVANKLSTNHETGFEFATATDTEDALDIDNI